MSGSVGKRALFVGVLGVLLAAALLALSRWTFGGFASQRQPPRLVIPGCSGLDLGEGSPGALLRGSFVVRNTGSEPLQFRLQGSCSCAELSPREGTIVPGDLVEISVAVQLRERGREETVQVRIESNDPLWPVVSYHVFARCPALVQVTPEHLHFGVCRHGTEVSRVAEVSFRAAQSGPCQVTTTNPHFQVEFLPSRSEPNSAGRLTVKLSPTAPRGSHPGEVHLSSGKGTEDEKVIVSVSAEVVGSLRVAPASVMLPAPTSPESSGVEAQVIVWRTDGRMLFPLTRVEGPAGLEVVDRSVEPQLKRVIVVRQTTATTLDSGVLQLYFSAIPEPIGVPFSSGKSAQLDKASEERGK